MQIAGDSEPGPQSGLVGHQKPVLLTTGLGGLPCRSSNLSEWLCASARAHHSLALTTHGLLALPCTCHLWRARTQFSYMHPAASMSTPGQSRRLKDRTKQSQHPSKGLSGCMAHGGVCYRLVDSSHNSLLGAGAGGGLTPDQNPAPAIWHNDKLCASLSACTGGSLSPLRLALGDGVPLSSPWKGRNPQLIPELVCLLWELRNIINGPSSMCST